MKLIWFDFEKKISLKNRKVDFLLSESRLSQLKSFQKFFNLKKLTPRNQRIDFSNPQFWTKKTWFRKVDSPESESRLSCVFQPYNKRFFSFSNHFQNSQKPNSRALLKPKIPIELLIKFDSTNTFKSFPNIIPTSRIDPNIIPSTKFSQIIVSSSAL